MVVCLWMGGSQWKRFAQQQGSRRPGDCKSAGAALPCLPSLSCPPSRSSARALKVNSRGQAVTRLRSLSASGLGRSESRVVLHVTATCGCSLRSR